MKKQSTKQIGDAGEELAAKELAKAGYFILDRNFRTRFGEIDIVAKKENTLIFVEVKAKKNDAFGAPAEMVTRGKQKKIIHTAQSYIQENEYQGTWRIDVVAIMGDEIEILENAVG